MMKFKIGNKVKVNEKIEYYCNAMYCGMKIGTELTICDIIGDCKLYISDGKGNEQLVKCTGYLASDGFYYHEDWLDLIEE